MPLPGTIAGGAGVNIPSLTPPGPPLGGVNNIVPFSRPTAAPVNPFPAPVVEPVTPVARPTSTATPAAGISGAGVFGAVAGGIAAGALLKAGGAGWAESVGAGLGTTGGSIVGQIAGGLIGSIAGPGGTAAGVFAGGMIGGLIGGAIGQYLGQLASDAITPTLVIPDTPKPAGSGAGVLYNVTIYQSSTSWSETYTSTYTNFIGPLVITSLEDYTYSWGEIERGRTSITSAPNSRGNYITVIGYKYYPISGGEVNTTYSIARANGTPEDTIPGTYGPNPARNPSGNPYNQANRPQLPAFSPPPAGFIPPSIPQPKTAPSPSPTPQPEPPEPLRLPPGPQISPTTPTLPEINPGPRPGVTPGPATDPDRPLRPLTPPATTPRLPTTPTPTAPGNIPRTPTISPPTSPPTTPLSPPNSPFLPPSFPPGTPPLVPPGVRPPAETPSRLINPPGQNPTLQPVTTPVTQTNETPQNPRCCQPDLSEIIKRLEQIKKRIGHDLYPVEVPSQIADPNVQNLPLKRIEDLTELQIWQVEQLDGIMGKWPAGIEIPGPNNTTVPLNLSNVAQAFTEQVGMLTSMAVTLAQTLHASTRSMIQAGSATQQAHLAHQVARANAEFLGYDNQTIATKIPLTYTPGKNPLDGLLNESSPVIKGWANKDKQDLKHILVELQQAAAIIRAVYWRKLDPKKDFEKQIKQIIEDKSEFIDSEQYREKPTSENDWKEFLRQVEEGFIEYRNIKANGLKPEKGEDNPYNRSPESQPKITDITDGDTNKKKTIERKRKKK